MQKVTTICGLVAGWMTIGASAKEFPLELKTLTAQEAMALPGSSGAYGNLQTVKPPALIKEPKAVSAHPLYGQLQTGMGNPPMLCRLDESKGEGKGYDELIVDLNRNNDLTDDPVTKRVVETAKTNPLPAGYERALFGPIQAGASQTVGLWRPSYAAEFTLYNRQFAAMGNVRNYMGYIRLKPACYLMAKVDLEEATQTIGLTDGNCNLRLGDVAKPMTVRATDGDNWYFQNADYFLRDWNGNSRFEATRFGEEAEFFAKMIYFGAQPYSVSLAPDCKTIRLEPYAGPLGELAVEPNGVQVKSLVLARETAPGEWEAFNPAVVNGKVKVQPGNYRLYSCTLSGKDGQGQLIQAAAYKRTPKDSVKVEAGQVAALKCGAPLTLEVTANKQAASGSSSGLMAAAIALFSGRSSQGPPELRINMVATGAGGESYSGYLKGDTSGAMPRPTFKISGEDGKLLASGNLEFG